LFALEGGEDLKGEVREMIDHALRATAGEYVTGHPAEWDLAGLRNRLSLDYFLVVDALPRENTEDHGFNSAEDVEDLVLERGHDAFRRKLASFGDHEERILSWVLLTVLDQKWRDHLYD